MLGPEFPAAYSGCPKKHVGLSHWLTVGLAAYASQPATRFGRSETVTPPGCVAALEIFSRGVAFVTVKGSPLATTAIAFKSQPPITPFRNLLEVEKGNL